MSNGLEENFIARNNLVFDNAFDFDGNPDENSQDWNSNGEMDSDFNMIKDGLALVRHGPNTLTLTADERLHPDNLVEAEVPGSNRLVEDKVLARQSADAYSAAALAGTATNASREQFLEEHGLIDR